MARNRKMSENPHLERFAESIMEANRLVEIHRDISGSSPGRRHKVEVLNRSGIVLLVAAWEGLIEDLATLCFEAIQKSCSQPSLLPNRIKSNIGSKLKESNNPLDYWSLAGNGWRNELKKYGQEYLANKIDYFHSPRPENIDQLFSDVIGIKDISKKWKWHRARNSYINNTLNKLIDLRGEIAHSKKSSGRVTKKKFSENAKFIIRITASTHNIIGTFMYETYGILLGGPVEVSNEGLGLWR